MPIKSNRSLGGGNSIFLTNIFQRGWFNHRLEVILGEAANWILGCRLLDVNIGK